MLLTPRGHGPPHAQLLGEYGHEAEHVTDIGPTDASDSTVWRYALERDAAIVTTDEDFADLVATGREAPPGVWVRIGNTRRAALSMRLGFRRAQRPVQV